MAEEGVVPSEHDQKNGANDDVFVNGSSDNAKNSGLLNPEYGVSLIPRRSSLIKDGTRRAKNDRKKTVSFSSMPNEKTVINAHDCLNYMQNGCELIKVRSNSRQYHRQFSLDPDLTEIRWQPSSKKPQKARIPVKLIKEVRTGKNTDILRNEDVAGHFPDECAFSIVYGENFETMDLIASSPDEVNIWVTGLTCLISSKTQQLKCGGLPDPLEERQLTRDKWLQEMFDAADTDNMGQIDEFEVVRLLKKFNTGLTTVKIQQKLKEQALCRETDKENRGRLNSSEFINLFKEIATRPEIYFLLVRYSSVADYMSTDDLLLFLEAEQGMTRITKEKCLEIVNRFEPTTDGLKMGQLGIDGFTAYLLSKECDLFDPECGDVFQDMSQPLSHYFIASSHNTYLLEDQLKGPSCVEAYIRAMKKGCRCVELDCWDGPNDEPVIYHGHTLTSKISFKSVIEAINQHAFTASKYPLILSIENHCSIKQQQTMAHIMKSVFQDKLCSAPPTSNTLPSPHTLTSKILVKCKKLEAGDGTEGYVTDEDEGAETDQRTNKKTSKRDGSVKKKHKLCKDLSDLVNYCKSVRFQDFQHSAQKGKFNELCSFCESSALKLANTCPEEFVNHNKRFLSRIYPNGMRVDSSNFNPQDLWNCGCQLVALNYQTGGLMMDLNDARFMQNGGCGYVLKPAIMREDMAYFSANTREVIPGVHPQILHVKIISGQQLPKPRGSGAKGDTIDPYVSIEIFGIPADCAEERTKTVQRNGHNPLFDESFEFQINLPELALVRFVVLDDEFIGDEFIGQYTVPFECMQSGYRHIQLKSNTGEKIPNCTIFLHVAITNKRGGGKASRRGLSVRRSKKTREYTSLKVLAIRSVDETFKLAVQPLRDNTDLRDNVHVTLAAFKQICGLAPISNIKQCMRILVSRIQGSCDQVTLHLIHKAQYPYLEAQGPLPEVLKKALLALDEFVAECKTLIERADDVHDKLLHAQQAAMEWHEDLQNQATQAGLKGKKLNKAMENFSWNVRVLKGQADLLRQAKVECGEYMSQIQVAAVSMGLVKENGSDKTTNSSPDS